MKKEIIIDGVHGSWEPYAIATAIATPLDAALQIAVPLIAEFEGFRANAYRDPVGVWTIGYGHTKNVLSGDAITKEGAEALLQEEVSQFMDGVISQVDVALNKNQLAALTSFAYNLGLGALSNSTLLRKLNSGDYGGAEGQFSRWVYAGGRVLNGLVKRRQREAELFSKSTG